MDTVQGVCVGACGGMWAWPLIQENTFRSSNKQQAAA